jgi:hypothetical protein
MNTLPILLYKNSISILAFVDEINATEGKKVNELLITDLILEKNDAIEVNHGVYIFKNKNQIVYVGKTSSRSFVERIPSHFDNRDKAWMNSLLKLLAKNKKISIEQAYQNFIKELELVLVLFINEDFTKEKILEVERCLIQSTPCINKKKKTPSL